jgi:hypothetical protein
MPYTSSAATICSSIAMNIGGVAAKRPFMADIFADWH